jgi:hypothetical protein
MTATQHTPDWFPATQAHDINGEPIYSLDTLRSMFEVRDLPGGQLVLKRTKDLWLKFALVSFAESEIGGANEMVGVEMHGSGTLGSLRECRHTWWGNTGGYVFYPNGVRITAMFRELAEFFDDMADVRRAAEATT